MTPTRTQIAEWREVALKHYIRMPIDLDNRGHLSSYVDGYIRARTEQAAEIAELKAKLAEPCTPITADMVTDEMQEQFLKTPYDAARKDVFVAAVNAWGAKQ